MAYCPQCGVEQRCGCDDCHTCGTPLVAGAGYASAPAPQPAPPVVIQKADRTSAPGVPTEAGPATRWLAPVFMLIGGGILAISVLEMLNTASRFPDLGKPATVGEGIIRTAHFAGILLYAGSVRLLTGFGLLAAGLLVAALALEHRTWRRAARSTGLAMVAIGFLYLATAVVVPLGTTSHQLQLMLPKLPILIPMLLLTAAAFVSAGYVVAAQLGGRRAGWMEKPPGVEYPRDDDGAKQGEQAIVSLGPTVRAMGPRSGGED